MKGLDRANIVSGGDEGREREGGGEVKTESVVHQV